MIVVGKTKVLGKNSVPVPLCPPQISHGLPWVLNGTYVVTGRQLTAWTMARTKVAGRFIQ
jgi:hypothetical protein